MFSQIAQVHDRRINDQFELLTDIGVLLEAIDVRYAHAIEDIQIALAQLGQETREAFAKDHTVYRWLQVMRAELLAAYEKGAPRSAEAKVPDMLVHFELAIAILTSNDYAFTLGDHSVRRFLLPVSRTVVDVTTPRPTSTIACRYLAASDALDVDGHLRPMMRYGRTRGITVVDSNLDLFFDPTGGQYPVQLDGSIDLGVWQATLECALDLIQRNPVAHELVDKFVTYLVPLEQGGEVRNLSFSARSLPGVIFKNNELTPHLIGETLVHEADHQFFYAIDRIGAMWTTDVTLQKAVYYSPWRDDPRPLDGILRGLSSFARVSHYYTTLLTEEVLQPADQLAAGVVLAKRLGEAEIALRTVVGSEDLSDFGSAYVEDIEAVLRRVRVDTQTIPRFGAWMSRASAEIESHRRAWEVTNRTCADREH